jgi:hypothetical protein
VNGCPYCLGLEVYQMRRSSARSRISATVAETAPALVGGLEVRGECPKDTDFDCG